MVKRLGWEEKVLLIALSLRTRQRFWKEEMRDLSYIEAVIFEVGTQLGIALLHELARV